jgi:hypothetical protein
MIFRGFKFVPSCASGAFRPSKCPKNGCEVTLCALRVSVRGFQHVNERPWFPREAFSISIIGVQHFRERFVCALVKAKVSILVGTWFPLKGFNSTQTRKCRCATFNGDLPNVGKYAHMFHHIFHTRGVLDSIFVFEIRQAFGLGRVRSSAIFALLN